MFYIKEPPKPPTQIIYSYRKKKFEPKFERSDGVLIIGMKSALLHCESTEAAIQIENELCSKKINLNKLS